MHHTSLSLNALSCAYPANTLFDGLTLMVRPGSLVMIQGQNGAGKTTLLKTIAGLHDTYTGSIKIMPVAQSGRSPCYFIGQQDGLKENLTVAENITFFSVLHDVDQNILASVLDLFNLHHIKNKHIKHCSTGQKKRTRLASLSVINAPIWLLDEPFVTLDAEGQAVLSQCILQHIQQQGIALISSHNNIPLKVPKTIRIQL